MKKSSFLALAFILFSILNNPTLYSQEKLSNLNTSWTSVLPGTPLCKPALTSYGFCIATDARNIMGYSSSGKLLWEKNVGRIRNVDIYTLPSDFVLFYDKSKDLLKLYNPSGTEIWSKTLDFKFENEPLPGRDGRFYIYSGTKVFCIGINGIIRWTLDTPSQKNIKAQELPDGSIIIFLQDENGATKGLRLSPFGEQIENITFAGSIQNTWTCREGVLLSFSDGSAGLFSIKDGFSVNRWVAQAHGNSSVFAVKADKSDFKLLTLSTGGVSIYTIDFETGSAVTGRTINQINGTDLKHIYYSEAGIFLCDKNKAVLLNSDFNEIWSARMPDAMRSDSISFSTYLSDDYLVFFGKNWTMNAYHTAQRTTKTNSDFKKNQNDYSAFIKLNFSEIDYSIMGTFLNAIKDYSIVEQLKNGNYGTKEQQWLIHNLSIAKMFCQNATTTENAIHRENTIFQTDSAGFENILLQLANFGTTQTQNAAADIIYKSTNKSFCKVLMKNICGYDPDGKLLAALEKNASTAGYKDSSYCNSICDAVYSICLFMGRPAYNKKGKEIIKRFMGAGYSSKVRIYARDTLKKIINLEL